MADPYEFTRRFADQIYKCSRCGFCQAVCPVYGLTHRPVHNARGKMLLLKEVLEGRLDFSRELMEVLSQCTTCATCTQNCPSGMQVTEIIKAARRDMIKSGVCHPVFADMARAIDEHGNVFGPAGSADFKGGRGQKAEYVFFLGCAGRYLAKKASRAAMGILDLLGMDYTLVKESCCFGLPAEAGFDFRPDLVERNLKAILSTGAHSLITACPHCFQVFNKSTAYEPLRAAGVKVLHLSQLLAGIAWGVKTELSVSFHDPCYLGRHAGLYEPPRQIIRQIAPGFVELPQSRAEALCCGAGGGAGRAFAQNSLALAGRVLAQARQAGAKVLLTDCHLCAHNLAQAMPAIGDIKVMTIAHLLGELLGQGVTHENLPRREANQVSPSDKRLSP